MKAPSKIWYSLLATLLLVGLGALGLFWASGQIEHAAEMRQQTHRTIIRAEDWLSEVKDAETGMRGYVLTGDKNFLRPYQAVQGELRERLADLRKDTIRQDARAHLDIAVPLLAEKLAHLAQVIALKDQNDTAGATALVASGQGRRVMDTIREEMNAFSQIEEAALASQEADYQLRMRNLFTFITLASLLTLVLALLFVGLMHRDTEHRLKSLVHQETLHLLGIQQETSRELAIAKTVADKANLAKSEFLSNMSHELRSPLNAVLGFAQLMETDTPPPTAAQKASIDQILHAGWYLLDLINEILDLAMVESGRLSLSLEPISLPEVLHECQEMIGPQAQKRGIHITFPVFAEPCFIKADRTRLKQVLINLLSNAIKYNRDGGSLIMDCEATSSDHLRINVRDTGAGLAPELLAQLFQPFNRLGKEATTEPGTGIGLVVSKRLVELMEGKIGATSKVGVGSVFWIELIQDTGAHSEHLKAAKIEIAAIPFSKFPHQSIVLYVEDHLPNLQLIQQLLVRSPGIQLVTAMNGQDGIDLALNCMPEVIIMDINLPGISGIEAMQILRQNPTTAHIPIVALSANAMPMDVATGLSAGFHHYLTKPINVTAFMETLNFTLEFAAKRKEPATLVPLVKPTEALA